MSIDQAVQDEPAQRKRPAAASVVAQARAKKQSDKNVASLNLNRIESTYAPDGRETLWLVFADGSASGASKIDISFLLRFPKLKPMFCEAFLLYGATIRQTTRKELVGVIRRRFFAYLQSTFGPDLGPDDIDETVLQGYRQFLLTAKSTRGSPIVPTSVHSALSNVRVILGSIRTGPWAKVARSIAERVPSGPVGAGRFTEPTEVLSLDALIAIMSAAETEVLAVAERWRQKDDLVAEGRRLLAEGNQSYGASFALCLAEIHDARGGQLVGLEMLEQINPALKEAVRYKHGGVARTSVFLYPSQREIVPFVLLLAIATAFNADTLLGLSWSDVDLDAERNGSRAIKISGEKPRAGRTLVRLLDPDSGAAGNVSLGDLLELLQTITASLRTLAPMDHANRLFVYAPTNGKKGQVISFRPSAKGGNQGGWLMALRAFVKENDLPPFVLKQIRPSVLDLVQFLGGSLEDARAVGDHRSPATTWTHYTSSTVKKRYRERIGEVMLLRDRWLATQGTIDPRRLTSRDHKGAATPGFICLDPYDSPRPNQKAGRLCSDYGGCPGCPLVAARPHDPTSVSFYRALQDAIYASQQEMAAHTWLQRWAPVLGELNTLLEQVPPSVMEEAKRIHITLPKVG